MTIARFAAPLYLALCLVAGGSGQGIWSNLLIQLIGIVILATSFVYRRDALQTLTLRSLRIIVVAGIIWCMVQLLPLPPVIWSRLGGRNLVAEGFILAGQSLPWMPISLTPFEAIGSLLALIPALALGECLLRWQKLKAEDLAATLLAVVGVGILLGIAQLQWGEKFYLYTISNFGAAAGFFANSNHMAALILVAIPFLFAWGAHKGLRLGHWRGQSVLVTLFILVGAVLMLGVVTNGSFAILLLGAPVLLASTLILMPSGGVRVGRLVALTGLLSVLGVGLLLVTALSGASQANLSSVLIRDSIWTHCMLLIEKFGILGSGLGSFAEAYALVEMPAEYTNHFINHAHNDYLELLIELGIPGAILIVTFLAWWLKRTIKLWRTREPDHFARAATIASAALLLHSLVDFPLRTAAMLAVFGMCLALMVVGARAWRKPASSKGEARHLTLDDLA